MPAETTISAEDLNGWLIANGFAREVIGQGCYAIARELPCDRRIWVTDVEGVDVPTGDQVVVGFYTGDELAFGTEPPVTPDAARDLIAFVLGLPQRSPG